MCGAATNLEFSDPAGDAPCPNCGHLLWSAVELLGSFQSLFSERFGISPDRVTADTSFAELGVDSLDMVEFAMVLEEEFDQFDLSISAEDAARIETVGDAIRYLEQRRRGSDR